MPAGLTIFNTHGTTQIDENWRNFGFRGKIDYPVSVGGSTESVDVTINIPGEAVMVACRANVFRPVPMNSYFDGTNWMFRWRFIPPFIGTAYSETVEFFIFDVLPDGGFSNVGLEVFDASGKRVFHSDMAPMRVPTGGVLPGTSSFTGEAGRSYVPLILRNPIFSEVYPFPTGIRHSTYALYCSGSSIISEYRGLGTPSLVPFGSTGLYAAVDVTGL